MYRSEMKMFLLGQNLQIQAITLGSEKSWIAFSPFV